MGRGGPPSDPIRPSAGWRARQTGPEHSGPGERWRGRRAALPVDGAAGYPGCRARGADRGRAGRRRSVPPGSRGDGCGIRASAWYPRASRSPAPWFDPRSRRFLILLTVVCFAVFLWPLAVDLGSALFFAVPWGSDGRSARRRSSRRSALGLGRLWQGPPVGCVAVRASDRGGGYAGEPLDALGAATGGRRRWRSRC